MKSKKKKKEKRKINRKEILEVGKTEVEQLVPLKPIPLQKKKKKFL